MMVHGPSSYMTTVAIARGVALVLSLFATTYAFGIADSGGCTGTTLGWAIRKGSAADAEREILSWVSRAESNRSLITRLFSSIAFAKRWREQRIVELIEGTNKHDLCEPLLHMALRAGNLEVVRYLTGVPAGVRPRVPPMTLFQCEHFYEEDDLFRARRLEAFEVVLRTGQANVNSPYYFGETLLQRCQEPELIRLFIDHGARLEAFDSDHRGRNLLDFAVIEAVSYDETESFALALHAVERARIFSRYLSIQAETERQVRIRCSPHFRERWNVISCYELSTFVKATPGTFGEAGSR
jgi:hypothetical protein